MGNKYKKNYLAKVAFRLDFTENCIIDSLDNYYDVIKDRFPIKEEKEGMTGLLQLNFKSGDVKNESEKMTSWLFSNDEKTKRIEVNSKFLYLEYDKYTDKKELFEDIKNVVQVFIKQHEVKHFNRIGLRFINEIKLSENEQLDWTNYINDNLISNITFVKENNKKLARALGLLVFKEEMGNVNFNYGMWNSEYPNEINRKEFILDYDCFSRLGITDEEIYDLAEHFHGYIEDLFEVSIKEKFRNLLNQ